MKKNRFGAQTDCTVGARCPHVSCSFEQKQQFSWEFLTSKIQLVDLFEHLFLRDFVPRLKAVLTPTFQKLG